VGPRRPTSGGRAAQLSRAPVDAARLVACDVLRAVDERDSYANLLLPALLRERGITGRDAAFATELTYGTLRPLGTYDAILGACSDRPFETVDPPLRAALRLGAHQLLGMRVPAHAAVAATVDLARAVAGPHTAGFANAILRRVAARDRDSWLAELAPAYDEDPIGHLALVHGHPRWIVEVYRDALGSDLEQTALACAADNVAPPVHLAARPGRITRDDLLAEAGPDAVPGRWSPDAVLLSGGDPASLAAVRSGRAGVQDEGSQLAAIAVAAAPVSSPDQRWLDVCAGPGGKAAMLAGLASERAAVLLCADLAPHRARLVARAVRGAPALVVVADASRPAWPAEGFDRVLLDAPCTGLGALRRRPDARWRRDQGDAQRLQHLQVALLDTAINATRRGGVTTYVTCSPHPMETTDVIGRAISARPDVVLEPVAGPLANIPGIGTGSHAQLWPHLHDTDAIFVQSLRRVEARR
jgi:16S rRNA (cytosine967-C5)-methyltransferase